MAADDVEGDECGYKLHYYKLPHITPPLYTSTRLEGHCNLITSSEYGLPATPANQPQPDNY